MRSFLILLLLVLAMPLSLFAQDDEDKTVFGKRASEWVAILRKDKEVLMRRRALIALESAGPQTRKIFDELGAALRTDTEEIVRVSATQVTGRLAAKVIELERQTLIALKPATDALSAALTRDKAASVREAAAVALGRMGVDSKSAVPQLGEALKDDSVPVRAAAADALASIGKDSKSVVTALTQAIAESKGKEQVRVRLGAVAAINRIGRPDGLPAVEALIGAIKETDPTNLSPDERKRMLESRRLIIETLGTLGDVAAFNVLTQTFEQALTDRDQDLGRASLTALTQLGGDKKALVPVLVKAMAPEPAKLQDRLIRCHAMHTLSQLGKELGSQRKDAIDTLRRCLGDKLSEVRLSAVLALGELGPEVIGDETKAIVGELQILRKSGDKAISEAADATIKRLEK